MLSRDQIESRLKASALRPEIVTVHLPVWGETVQLRRPTRDQITRVQVAAGDDEDWRARFLVGLLRFALVDDRGEPLLRSFPEASALFNAMDPEDLSVLYPALHELANDEQRDGTVEAGEVGKAS